MGLQFDFSDRSFYEWLFSALKQEGFLKPNSSGSFVIDLQTVSDATQDNILGDRFISLPQREYLLRSLKAGSITFDVNGELIPPSPPWGEGKVRGSGEGGSLFGKVDAFFQQIGKNAVQGKTGRFGEASDWIATRVWDTGTDEEKLEELLRSLSPEEMPRFKELVARHFASEGKSLEEILTEELSSRELGRMLGVVRTAGKTYSSTPERALATEGEVHGITSAHSMREHGFLGNEIESFRQNRWPKAYFKALNELKGKLNDIRRGKSEEGLSELVHAVFREAEIFRLQEHHGSESLDSSMGASVAASKTVAISSAAILTGGAAPAMLGAGVLVGGAAGTAMGVVLNIEEKAVRGEKISEHAGVVLRESAMEGFASALSLGVGGAVAQVGIKTGSKLAQHAVTQQVVINETIGLANTGLRGDLDNYGIADVAVSGISGAIGGGVIDRHLKGAANLTAEMAREAGENLAEAHIETGNLTTEDAIGAVAGALSELGGSVGKNHHSAKPSLNQSIAGVPGTKDLFIDRVVATAIEKAAGRGISVGGEKAKLRELAALWHSHGAGEVEATDRLVGHLLPDEGKSGDSRRDLRGATFGVFQALEEKMRSHALHRKVHGATADETAAHEKLERQVLEISGVFDDYFFGGSGKRAREAALLLDHFDAARALALLRESAFLGRAVFLLVFNLKKFNAVPEDSDALALLEKDGRTLSVIGVFRQLALRLDGAEPSWLLDVSAIPTTPLQVQDPLDKAHAGKWVPLLVIGTEGLPRTVPEVVRQRTDALQGELLLQIDVLEHSKNPEKEPLIAAYQRVEQWLHYENEESLAYANLVDHENDFVGLVWALNLIKGHDPVLFVQMMGINPFPGTVADSGYWGNFLQKAVAATYQRLLSVKNAEAIRADLDSLLTIGSTLSLNGEEDHTVATPGESTDLFMARAGRLLQGVPPRHQVLVASALAVMSPEGLLELSIRGELPAFQADEAIVRSLLTLLGDEGIDRPWDLVDTIAAPSTPVAVLERLDVSERLAKIFGEELADNPALLKKRCETPDDELRTLVLERNPLVVVEENGRVRFNNKAVASIRKNFPYALARRAVTEDSSFNYASGNPYTHLRKTEADVIPQDRPFKLAFHELSYDDWIPTIDISLVRLGFDAAEIDFSEVIKAVLITPNPPAALEKYLADLLARIPEGEKREAAFDMIVRHAKASKKFPDYVKGLISMEVYALLPRRRSMILDMVPEYIRDWEEKNVGSRKNGTLTNSSDPGREKSFEFVSWFGWYAPLEAMKELGNSDFYKYFFEEIKIVKFGMHDEPSPVRFDDPVGTMTGLRHFLSQHPEESLYFLGDLTPGMKRIVADRGLRAPGGVEAFFRAPDDVLKQLLYMHMHEGVRIGVEWVIPGDLLTPYVFQNPDSLSRAIRHRDHLEAAIRSAKNNVDAFLEGLSARQGGGEAAKRAYLESVKDCVCPRNKADCEKLALTLPPDELKVIYERHIFYKKDISDDFKYTENINFAPFDYFFSSLTPAAQEKVFDMIRAHPGVYIPLVIHRWIKKQHPEWR